MSIAAGDNIDLTEIKSTVHIGAHADAPSHYHLQGRSIEQRSLSLYLGETQVIEVKLNPSKRIYPEDLKQEIIAPRILFKTNSFPHPDIWNDDFNSLSPELVFYLHNLGVKLVGIDTPSVDPAQDKEMSSHQALFKADMAVLEGIILEHVPSGFYNLIALPLNISGACASPVRAILIPKESL